MWGWQHSYVMLQRSTTNPVRYRPRLRLLSYLSQISSTFQLWSSASSTAPIRCSAVSVLSIRPVPQMLLLPVIDGSSLSSHARTASLHLLPLRAFSHAFPDDYWALNLLAFSPSRGCLICASCSSGRGFACRFLQTPPRGGSPCSSANGSHHQGP